MNFLIPFSKFISYLTLDQVFSIAGYGVVLFDIGMALIILYYLKRIFWNGDRLIISYNAGMIFVGIFILAIVLSAVYPLFDGSSGTIVQYFKSTLHLVFAMIIIFIAMTRPIDTLAWKRMIKVVLLLSILINMFGIYQLFARIYDLPYAYIEYDNVSFYSRDIDAGSTEYRQSTLGYENFFRGTSIFSEPSAYAGFNSLVLVFSLIPYLNRRQRFFKNRSLNILIIVLTVMGLFLTFSLSAILQVTMILTGAMILNWRYLKRFILYIAVIMPLLIISTDSVLEDYTGISVVELFKTRIEGVVSTFSDSNKQISGESFGKRLNNAYYAYKIWEKSPVTGVGLGLFAEYNTESNESFSDNTILGVLSNMGFLGFMAFNLIFGFGFYKGYVYFKNLDKYNLSESDKTLYSLAIYIFVYLFSITYFSANMLTAHQLWLYIAVVFSLVHKRQLDMKNNIYTVKLLRTPLKVQIGKGIENYIKLKKIT